MEPLWRHSLWWRIRALHKVIIQDQYFFLLVLLHNNYFTSIVIVYIVTVILGLLFYHISVTEYFYIHAALFCWWIL